jgi:hypothetical protein
MKMEELKNITENTKEGGEGMKRNYKRLSTSMLSI